MDRAATEPLTPEGAKQRLRLTLEEATTRGWIRRHPLTALTIAFSGGFAYGGDRRLRRLLRAVLLRTLF